MYIGGASVLSVCWLARWRHLLESHALHVGGATVSLMEFLSEVSKVIDVNQSMYRKVSAHPVYLYW